MRIISGKWGGRRLASFKSSQIRPTTDRVKETIFNMIGPDIHGVKVLDLFSGTGSMSFEALSRGASQVVSVDKGRDAKAIIHQNAKLLDVSKEEWTFVGQDISSYLKKSRASFDIILIDPPFTMSMGAEVMKRVHESMVYAENTYIFIEYVGHEDLFDIEGSNFKLLKKRDYKDKKLCVYLATDKDKG